MRCWTWQGKLGGVVWCLKVNFEKVCNSMDWGVLDYMLQRFGFDAKWISWTKAYIFGGDMSILTNESQTKQICIQRGLI